MTLETTSCLSLGQCLPPMGVLTSGESSAHTNSPQGQTLELVPRGPPHPPQTADGVQPPCVTWVLIPQHLRGTKVEQKYPPSLKAT